jgi:hypothetical protein
VLHQRLASLARDRDARARLFLEEILVDPYVAGILERRQMGT